MKKYLMILVTFVLTIMFVPMEKATANSSNQGNSTDSSIYELELARWNVSNNGTRPHETTKGINEALNWAKENGYTSLLIPDGTYSIAKGNAENDRHARINMLSDMTFLMSNNTILQKEPNGFEEYSVLHVGAGVKNVVIQGGTLIGDREDHNYSGKSGDWSSGTHEWGHGISIVGGENITVDGVKIKDFTGDGIYIGGSTIGGAKITENILEKGSLDESGNPIKQEGKIRTVGRTVTNFDNNFFDTYKNLHMWLPEGLTSKDFTIYYYSKDDTFISREAGRVYSNGTTIPDGADYYRAVFDAESTTGVKVNQMTIDNPNNVTIKNNDINHNRRQGITAGGENVEILNNTIQNTRGTAPQAGIDIEPGHYPATNHLIKGNTFLDNKIQIVLAYGENVTIDDNYFEQTDVVKCGVGLHIHKAYRGSKVVTNNTFNGSGMTLYPDGMAASNNSFTNAGVTLHGDSQELTDSEFHNATLNIGTGKNQKIANLHFTQNGELGGDKSSLYVDKNAIHATDITILANTEGKRVPGMIHGYGNNDSIYENLTVKDDAQRGTVLLAGTYLNPVFDVGNLGINREGKYIFDNANIKGEGSLLRLDKLYGEAPEVIIQNSTLELTKDIGYGAAIYILGAKDFQLLDSVVLAKNNTIKHAPIIKFGPYGYPKPTNIAKVSVKGNEIQTKKGVIAIDTTNAGSDAPPYYVENNKIVNGLLYLSEKDINNDNELIYN